MVLAPIDTEINYVSAEAEIQMQPFITLQSSDLASFGGEPATGPVNQGDAADGAPRFRDHLRQLATGSDEGADRLPGQLLPDGGKFLPARTFRTFAPGEDFLPAAYRGDLGTNTEPAAAGTVAPVPLDAFTLRPDLSDGNFGLSVLPPDPLASDQIPLEGELSDLPVADGLAADGRISPDAAVIDDYSASQLTVVPAASQALLRRSEEISNRPPEQRFGRLQPVRIGEVASANDKAQQLPVIRNPEGLPPPSVESRAQPVLAESLAEQTAANQRFIAAVSEGTAMAEALPKPAAGQGGQLAQPVVSGLVNGPLQAALPTSQVLPTATLQIDIPLSDPEFGQALGDRVLWMNGRNVHGAEIRLNPAELGPLRVKITVEDGAANVAFNAQHSVTREAIEQALPRLREMLAESGLSFGGASVSDEGVAQEQAGVDDSVFEGVSDSGAEADTASDDASAVVQRRGAAGLIDTFA